MTLPVQSATVQSALGLRDLAHYVRPGLLQLPALPPLSVYVHLPWCLRKCPYCDFNSHAADASGVPQQRYVQALLADLELALPLVWGRRIHSIFLGGGTPSLFAPECIEDLLTSLRARLPLEPDCEITLEANPGTFEKDRFRAYRSAGVNRLSIGVQSFSDANLRALGRVHDGTQAWAAVQEAAQAFDNFNLDIMYALPAQTPDGLRADMVQALQARPTHLSVYQLTIEPNTWFALHPPQVPEDDTAYAMLDLITEMTEHAGLPRYEVSAYARSARVCRHNLNYWQFGDYLGIGAGAHSKLSFAHRVVRQQRLRDPARYMEQALAGHCLAQEQEIALADLAFEFMLNALRLKGGFAPQLFASRTGLSPTAIEAACEQAQRLNLLQCDAQWIQPTARGYDLLNDLMGLFLPRTAQAGATLL